MLVLLPQYNFDAAYEPQDDLNDDCVAMAPLDGYYFHNEDCASQFSALCQLDTDDNSEQLKKEIANCHAGHLSYCK